jgi:hypothetical protein
LAGFAFILAVFARVVTVHTASLRTQMGSPVRTKQAVSRVENLALLEITMHRTLSAVVLLSAFGLAAPDVAAQSVVAPRATTIDRDALDTKDLAD